MSCTPGLQSLDMRNLQHSAEVLASLQRLSGLHTLGFHVARGEQLEAMIQLTGVRDLRLTAPGSADGRLLRLTQLTQLTSLIIDADGESLSYTNQVGLHRVGGGDCAGP